MEDGSVVLKSVSDNNHLTIAAEGGWANVKDSNEGNQEKFMIAAYSDDESEGYVLKSVDSQKHLQVVDRSKSCCLQDKVNYQTQLGIFPHSRYTKDFDPFI